MTQYDYVVLVIFALTYIGYHFLYLAATHTSRWQTRESVIAARREGWFRNILQRREPILAIQSLRNLIMIHTFFGSLLVLIMGGIFSYFFSEGDWLALLESHDYFTFLREHPIAPKLLVALLMQMISFVNFILAVRVCFNLVFTLTNPDDPEGDLTFQLEQIQRHATHFMTGVRALYYSIAPLLWTLDTTLMLVATVLLTLGLLRFDFFKGTTGPAV